MQRDNAMALRKQGNTNGLFALDMEQIVIQSANSSQDNLNNDLFKVSGRYYRFSRPMHHNHANMITPVMHALLI